MQGEPRCVQGHCSGGRDIALGRRDIALGAVTLLWVAAHP
eukprot:COSAG03_NODE_11860_length_573_cov_0.721519_1_plen_39_part_10